DPVLPGELGVVLGERPDVGIQLGHPPTPVGQLELRSGGDGHRQAGPEPGAAASRRVASSSSPLRVQVKWRSTNVRPSTWGLGSASTARSRSTMAAAKATGAFGGATG